LVSFVIFCLESSPVSALIRVIRGLPRRTLRMADEAEPLRKNPKDSALYLAEFPALHQ
jgi:hypothetical protein